MAAALTQEEMQEVTRVILADLQGWFKLLPAKHPDVDNLVLGKLAAIAMSNFVGHLAIDVGMPEEQYVTMCQEIYNEAWEITQRWGQ